MLKQERASVVLKVIVKLDPDDGACKRDCQRCLAADQCFVAQVIAVEFYQVEGAQEHPLIMPRIPDQVEQRDAIRTARDRLSTLRTPWMSSSALRVKPFGPASTA
jgi:hypothetical protein